MNARDFGSDAVARYYARHRAADDAAYNAAGFTWNPGIKAFEVEVREHIVGNFPNLADVRAFCAMHNHCREL